MFEQLLKLLLEPLRGIIDHLVRLALADVQGYDVAVVAVAVERLGADVEGTEAALAGAVRSGDNRKFWATLHLSRNEIRVTAFARSGGAAKNAVGATAAVESNAVFAAVGIGQISVSVVIEERHGNATAPRIGIDALYLTARRTIGFAGRLAVWQLDNINVFICAHNRFPLSFDGAKLQLFCE